MSLSILGRYRLERRLGRGGMAEVFAAEHCGAGGFERPVCIKKILPELTADEDFRRLFVREARVAGRLTHANIVQVFDCIEDDQSLAIVMELVHGLDLRDLIRMLRRRGEKLPEPLVAHVAGQLLAGLGFAHRQQVVHRDVSPHNVMISREGEVKLADFGVAKVMITINETRTGELKGKVPYMSPEQVRGKKDIDGRTDLYSAGLVLYELLHGERFFEESSYGELVGSVFNAKRPVLQGVESALASLVESLLEPDRERRFQTAEEALRALPPWPEVGPLGALLLGEVVRGLVDATTVEPATPRHDETARAVERSPAFEMPIVAFGNTHSPHDTKIDPGGTEILPGKPKLQERLERPVIPGSPTATTAPRDDDVEMALALAPTTRNEAVDPYDTIEITAVSELQLASPTSSRRARDEQPRRSFYGPAVVIGSSCVIALVIAAALWLGGPRWLEQNAPASNGETASGAPEPPTVEEGPVAPPASFPELPVEPMAPAAVVGSATEGAGSGREVVERRTERPPASSETTPGSGDGGCTGAGCSQLLESGAARRDGQADSRAGPAPDAGSRNRSAADAGPVIQGVEVRPLRRSNAGRRKNRGSSGDPAARPFDGNPFATGRSRSDR